MSTRNLLLLLVLGGAAGYAMFNIEKFQGCTDTIQVVALEMDDYRPIACNQADIGFVGVNGGAPQVELDCGTGPQRAVLYGASATTMPCGFQVRALETWQGGTVTRWNTRLEITWEEE